LSDVKLISKPGLRVYWNREKIGGYKSRSVLLISTPFGNSFCQRSSQKRSWGRGNCRDYLIKMSKIGRQPIEISEGVEVKITPGKVEIKGPKGSLSRLLPKELKLNLKDNLSG